MVWRRQQKQMQERRYQVYLCTAGLDMQPERITLLQTLAGMGFFCWGPELRTPQHTAFARRQIDECDYFILLVGGRYGELTPSGVSYMHLEYIYAVTKQKPVLAILHAEPERREAHLREPTDDGRAKLDDFRKRLLQDQILHLTYQDCRDLDTSARLALPRLLEKFPVKGWIRAEQAGHAQPVRSLRQSLQLPAERPMGQPSAQAVSGDHAVAFEYRVHAYQDGNFKELRLSRQLSTFELLEIFAPVFSDPALEDLFARTLHDYLDNTALGQVHQVLPRAHAVARSQVSAQTIQGIRDQLRHNGWIEPLNSPSGRQRALWQLTSMGQNVMAMLRQQQTGSY